MAERHSIRQRFWAGLLERAQARTSLHASISPRDQGWAATGAGKTGLSFSYFSRQHDSQAELYIYAGKESRDRNKAIFDELIAQREKVESLFGGPLKWQRLDRKCACRIRKVIDAGGYRDPEEDWPRIQDAMIDAMIRLEKSLKGPIAALRV